MWYKPASVPPSCTCLAFAFPGWSHGCSKSRPMLHLDWLARFERFWNLNCSSHLIHRYNRTWTQGDQSNENWSPRTVKVKKVSIQVCFRVMRPTEYSMCNNVSPAGPAWKFLLIFFLQWKFYKNKTSMDLWAVPLYSGQQWSSMLWAVNKPIPMTYKWLGILMAAWSWAVGLLRQVLSRCFLLEWPSYAYAECCGVWA